jgi:hypothetical protein
MEEAPENGKELLHSAHVNGMNEWKYVPKIFQFCNLGKNYILFAPSSFIFNYLLFKNVPSISVPVYISAVHAPYSFIL